VQEYERLGKYMPPNQFDISWEEFRSIEVPLPPLEEQCRIAKYLDVANSWIDQSVTAISKRIELLESKRRALLGLTFSNPESRSIRLGYYLDLVTSGPRGWGEYTSAQGRIFFRSANLRRCLPLRNP
jgi:type I restriction enzyme S subunit